MPCVAEFGIIDNFEENKDYSIYEPEQYNCIAINDDYITDWWNNLGLLKTYFHCFNRPNFSLARHGVTLIPPQSLEQLLEIVSSDKRSKSSEELIDLMILLQKAKSDNKYVIHYGI